ncbi:MAG: hypothetical protein AB1414_15010 [bacterium]
MQKLSDIVNHLLSNLQEGTLIITLGAGDVWKVADKLVERLKKDGIYYKT